MKKNVLILLLLITAMFLAGCTAKSSKIENSNTATSTEVTSKKTISNICDEFNADFLYSAIGKKIVKVERVKTTGVYACKYYTSYKTDFIKTKATTTPGGPNIMIVLENINVAEHKAKVQKLGAVIKTDSRIKMDHFIIPRVDKKSVWQIGLVLNQNLFYWLNTSYSPITDDELIKLAAKVVEKIQNKVSFEIKKNPVKLDSKDFEL